MAFLSEKLGDAWGVLRGLKRAVSDPARGARATRIGSPAGSADDDIKILSSAAEFYRNYTHLEPDRISIYSDMDEMFQYVLVSAALEAYIEDATQEDPRSGLSIWPVSDDPTVQAHLQRLFEQMEIEDRINGDMWQMAKYGDMFGLLLYDKDRGVFDMPPIEPRIVHRHEDSKRVLRGFSVGDTSEATDAEDKNSPKFKPWDMVHFRIRGKRASDPYGSPFFMQVRLTYKILKLMEEQMVIYRMNMHPDRLVFKIFTGNMGPDERRNAMRGWRREMEKLTSIDHRTGRFTSEYAPWFMTGQNLYFPVGANDQVSGVEKFPGSANAGDIFDVEYIRDLLFAGMRVPKAYMGFEDSQGYRGTDTLSAQSIKFARGVRRLQRFILQGYTRLCRIHLAIHGIDSRQPQHAFRLEMTPVSYLDEAHKAELYAKRYEALGYMLDIGQRMQDTLGSINQKVWGQYVLKEFGGFDDSMISKLLAPDEGTADMTYLPSGSRLTFESKGGKTELSEDDRKRIRDVVMGDETLQRVIRQDLAVGEMGFRTVFESERDRVEFCSKNEFGGTLAEGCQFTLVDDAVKTTRKEEIARPRRLKEKREKELRGIAQQYVEQWGESMPKRN